MATAPTHLSMVRRITRAYRSAAQDPTNLAIGLGWYDYARAQCQEMADRYSVSLATAVGTFAALSPRCQLSTNLRWTEVMLAAAAAGLTTAPECSTMDNRATAWAIARGADPLSALGTVHPRTGRVISGMKVRNFFRNTMGDTHAVTCDVWAAVVATGERSEALVGSPVGYGAVERAYQRAAAILGVTPREVQAAVWVHARGLKPSDVAWHVAAGQAAA